MAWTVDVSRPASRDLRAIRDRPLRDRLTRAMLTLEADPRPAQAKKLAGFGDIWRLRVGDWRICYAIRDARLVVLVVAVGQRREIHERLRRRVG